MNAVDVSNYGPFRQVTEATFALLEALEEGEKTSLPVLTAQVAEKTGSKPSAIQALVNIAVHQHPGVTVLRGRFGGIIKGKVVTKKSLDKRPRCNCCKQVIRQRKTSSAATVKAATVSEPDGSGLEEEFDEFLNEDDDA